MKLEKYLDEFKRYSGKTSDVARQLSFAGIAIIWIFKTGDGIQAKIPNDLILPLGFLCMALASDLLQYLLGTIIWDRFHRYHELRAAKDKDIKASPWLRRPIDFFFWFKIIFVIIAYTIIIRYVYTMLFPQAH